MTGAYGMREEEEMGHTEHARLGQTATPGSGVKLEGGHTPGPWFAEPAGWVSGPEHKGMVADCGPTYGGASPEGKANARLIAAAPALLEAVKAFIAAVDRGFDKDKTVGDGMEEGKRMVAMFRAAIAKAEAAPSTPPDSPA